MKRIVKDYFSFSKRERTAVIILLLLASVFAALPYFFSVKGEMPVIDPALVAFIKNNKPPVTRISSSAHDDVVGNEVSQAVTLFRFDPNTLPAAGWIRLGLKPKTAATIINYRNKGGKFRFPEDIRKIWGLSKPLADKLVPYVDMEATAGSSFHPKEFQRKEQSIYGFHKMPVAIDINTATQEEWEALPGIGDVLAKRIVGYREKVGGFSGIMQVKKVYGISDSVFTLLQPFLKAGIMNIPKLDLNTVNQYLLAERTGISLTVAKGIVVYRQQYGQFKTVEDLRKIIFVTDSIYNLVKANVVVKPG